jgi:hypothetical protein
MKKSIGFLFLFLITATVCAQTFPFSTWAQIGSPTYRGKTFTKDAYSFVKTVSGNTMTAKLSISGSCSSQSSGGFEVLTTECMVACDCSGSGPTYGSGNNSPTNSGTSLVLGMNASNKTYFMTLDLTFSTPIVNPNFTIYDLNTNNNFADQVTVSATSCGGATIFPSSVTGRAANTAYNSANGLISQTIVDNTSRGNTGSNVTVNFTSTVTAIKIVYGSGSTIPVGSDPSAQFIYIGQIVSTVAAPCTVLPIELTEFKGKRTGSQVKLDWQTASEKNNEFFTIERSLDGINFEEVKRVKGAGDSYKALSYEVYDQNPLSEMSYYRLKQTDFNGQFKYSNIVSIDADNSKAMISHIAPNPTTSDINFDFYAPVRGELIYEITDLTGRVIISKTEMKEEGNTKVLVDLDEIPNGIYFLKVSFEKTSFISVNKIFKN